MKLAAAFALSLVAVAVVSAGGYQVKPATISGMVVSNETSGQPIARATVTVSGAALPNGLSTMTSDDGRYVFGGLPAGRYLVTVTKPAFLPVAFGATRPGRPGTPVAVEAGQGVDLRIALPKGAVITGTVRDHLGQPAPGVQVMITRANQPGAAGVFIVDTPLTDDRGEYRVFGLMPDEYFVSASPSRIPTFGETTSPGRADIDAKLRRLESRGAPSTAPVSGQIGSAADPATPSGPIVFTPLYYPGTPNSAEAVPVRVGIGEERRNVDIALTPVRAARATGFLQTGAILPTQVRLILTPVGNLPGLFFSQSLVGPLADGSFSFTGLTPGRYQIVARYTLAATGETPAVNMFGLTEFSIAGSDISGLALALRPARSISGRVVFDASSQKPPENLEILRLNMTAIAGDQLPLAAAMPSPVSVRSDGTFRFTGVLPGTYGFATPSAGWWLRSVVINGRDVLDYPLVVAPDAEDITNAIATFSDRRAELHGSLITSAGRPASEFVVIVYPADRAQWRPGARRIKSVRPGTDGAFTVTDLPGGEYFVAAVTDAEPSEWQQPEFLEQLVPASVKVTIADGQKLRQDLRIAKQVR